MEFLVMKCVGVGVLDRAGFDDGCDGGGGGIC
jgi:hypothetical protein